MSPGLSAQPAARVASTPVAHVLLRMTLAVPPVRSVRARYPSTSSSGR
jgi:hypothetical protein